MKKRLVMTMLLIASLVMPSAAAMAEDDYHGAWVDEKGDLYEWNGTEYENMGPVDMIEGGDPMEDVSIPYAWYDSKGDVWYWDGQQDVYIGSGEDYYIEGTDYFESDGAVWEEDDLFMDGEEDWNTDEEFPLDDEMYFDDMYEPVLVTYVKGEKREEIYDGDMTPESLAEGLSALTGFAFSIECETTDEGLRVVWKDDSTMIAGFQDMDLVDTVFESYEEIQWSMLDSLTETLRYNLEYANIWYTDEEKNPLVLEKVELSTLPYFGSAYYEEFPEKTDVIETKEQAELGFRIYLEELIEETGAEFVFAEEGKVGEKDGYIFELNGEFFSLRLGMDVDGVMCTEDEMEGTFGPIVPIDYSDYEFDWDMGEMEEMNISLLIPPAFDGAKELVSEEHEDGTYYYSSLTADGLTTIVNTSLPAADITGLTFEEYLIQQISGVNNGMPADVKVGENEALSEKYTYPVFELSWQNEEGEEPYAAKAFFMLTDLNDFIYQLCATGDAMDGFDEFAAEAFDAIEFA
ncbi:MAG: hypothetical protein KBT01_09455 [Clostridiales bacterium]|nr:hypothetical protein [Candidatus Blautia equi]